MKNYITNKERKIKSRRKWVIPLKEKATPEAGGTASRRLSSGSGLFFHSLRGWEKGADEVAVSIHIINTS